jgi:hypothetical protein
MYWQVYDFRNTSPQQERNEYKMQAKCIEDPILRLPKDKRAHLAEQTVLPGHESPRIITRAHLLANQRKAVPGRHHPGSVELGRLPGCPIFGGKIILIFLKAVAQVSIRRHGGNRPLKL